MSDTMSQEEIEAMLAGAGAGDDTDSSSDSIDSGIYPTEDFLTRDEQDLLGELGNICMGTSATTMSLLLGRKVTITTPKVSIQDVDSLSEQYPAPLVISEIRYVKGLDGDNLLVLKEYDVALITNLMLGESTDIDEDNIELTEIHMSAIGEVMNQMVGSSATALADLTHQVVDISTPVTRKLSIKDNGLSDAFDAETGPFVKISFVMEIEDLLTSEIMQILSVDFAKELAAALWKQMQADMGMGEEEPAAEAPQAAAQAAPQPAASAPTPEPPPAQPTYTQPPVQQAPPPGYDPYGGQQGYAQPGYAQAPPPGYGYPQQGYGPAPVVHEGQSVRVQQPQFQSFSSVGSGVPSLENIEMILDVPMSVTVELGRTKKKIKEILEFNTGSVIVLDRPAGEMVDILVNGKIIGKGEVVVIDDNYGVRIAEINMPNNANELF